MKPTRSSWWISAERIAITTAKPIAAQSHGHVDLTWASVSLVTLPEWAERVNTPSTHGDAYEEAVRNGNDVLELLIEATLEDGEPLPQVYASA